MQSQQYAGQGYGNSPQPQQQDQYAYSNSQGYGSPQSQYGQPRQQPNQFQGQGQQQYGQPGQNQGLGQDQQQFGASGQDHPGSNYSRNAQKYGQSSDPAIGNPGQAPNGHLPGNTPQGQGQGQEEAEIAPEEDAGAFPEEDAGAAEGIEEPAAEEEEDDDEHFVSAYGHESGHVGAMERTRDFPQDPNHARLMADFHEIAEEGLTDDHLQDIIHLGTFALAYLARHLGMTHQYHSAARVNEQNRRPVKKRSAAAAPAPAGGQK